MTALCTVADIEARLGRSLSAEETARVDAAITDASALVLSVAPTVPLPPDTPDAAVGVTARLALRLTVRGPEEAGVASESLGGYAVSYRDAQGVLDSLDLDVLRPWRRSKVAGMQVDAVMAVVEG